MSKGYKSIRVFKSPFLEYFTHVPPLLPLLLWLPVVAYFFWRTFYLDAISVSAALTLAAIGVAVWTLAEYLLHRFVFHFKPRGPLQRRLQFILHGMHHDDINDPTRLVMSPVVGAGLALGFYGLFLLLAGPRLVDPFFASFIAGYLWYDYTHYYVHHFVPRTRVGKLLKKNHLLHHHSKTARRWGVSSPLWDHVFGTY